MISAFIPEHEVYEFLTLSALRPSIRVKDAGKVSLVGARTPGR